MSQAGISPGSGLWSGVTFSMALSLIAHLKRYTPTPTRWGPSLLYFSLYSLLDLLLSFIVSLCLLECKLHDGRDLIVSFTTVSPGLYPQVPGTWSACSKHLLDG